MFEKKNESIRPVAAFFNFQAMANNLPELEHVYVPYIEGGALRGGGVPDIWSKDYVGVLVQYAVVGVIYGGFPRTIYPFLNNYLNMDGYQTVAAVSLVSLAWSFKAFIGVVTDSFPIYGLRRKPYMIIGWIICLILLLTMAILPVEDPYFLADNKINSEAKASGSRYILLMMLTSFGYMIACVAADGMVVELSQREPVKTRGNIQATIYFTRAVSGIFSGTVVGFCMNGSSYGGQFNWSLDFNQVMLMLCLPVAWAIPASIWFVKEDRVSTQSFRLRCREMWKIVQHRTTWQIMTAVFFSGAFGSFGAAPAASIQQYWAKVPPLNDTIMSILSQMVFAFLLYATKTFGLNWNWRITITVVTLSTLLLNALVSFLTIFDVFRNEWFWFGAYLEEIPARLKFVISTFIVVEIAQEGYEGATYGLITTVSNLSLPFASSICKHIDSYFNAFKDDVERDDDEARIQVAYTFVIMYLVNILSLAWLVFLPSQKRQAQVLKRTGGQSKVGGIIALGSTVLVLIYSVTTNIMSIFPTTACLKIAGGDGKC